MRQCFIAPQKPLLGIMAIKYKNSSRFNRLFKKLCKKYKTLPNDFDKLKKLSISLFHNPDIHFDNQGIVKIPGFNTSKIVIFKVKKFACRSLKGGAMSGLRVVYAYHIKKELVEFIEIYYKGNQSNHNEHLINEYLKQFGH